MGDNQPKRKGSISIQDARIAGLYDLEKTIGKGHFAVVKLASHVFTGEKVAVKVIDKSKFDEKMASHFMQEVRCMKLVQHPNIVRLYEVIDTQTKLFLILELGDYDMYDFIMRNADKGCPEDVAQQYFCQIINAIDYCHKLHVVHRDLKPENVVFFEKLGMVKLTDFGFSNKFTPGEQLATSCGSLAYSAPEILLGDAYDAPAVDVWSLGVILYMLLCGRLPFQEANDSETLTKILDCKYTLPDHLSHHARHLISRMLVKDASKRATLQEIVSNPWVAAGERGLAQILPLVGKAILPESAHATIIEQMVAGGVDTEDRILRSLENNDYSYATATYYLLAERVLASYREEKAREVLAVERSPLEDLPSDSENHNENNSDSTSSSNTATRCRSRSNSWRSGASVARRPCAILKEESEEELSSYLRSSSRQSSRNSSPSISIFGSQSTSKERVSSQAIQGLLELSRVNLAEGRRRAASPESRNSRSPSPPGSTGRSSPAFGITRLKTIPGTGGMRKLSSSPHLLGICEESEESEFPSVTQHRHAVTRRSISSVSALSPVHVLSATKASSESGVASTNSLTYSKVRMIRPRQAVVSPDMASRYEPRLRHRFTSGRTRRSTSCSSSCSEASDDDSSERRKNLFVSRCCRCNSDVHGDNDDTSGGGGCAGGGNSGIGSGKTSSFLPNNGDTSCVGPGGDSLYEKASPDAADAVVAYNKSIGLGEVYEGVECNKQIASTPLHPIMELPVSLFTRKGILYSDTQNWLVCTNFSFKNDSRRNSISKIESKSLIECHHKRGRLLNEWDLEYLRALRFSLSVPCIFSNNLNYAISQEHEEEVFSEEELDSLSWTSVDSGCLSDNELNYSPKIAVQKAKIFKRAQSIDTSVYFNVTLT